MTNLLRTLSRTIRVPLLVIALAFGAPAALAATITVNTEADNATDGLCSFTEAIASANTDTAVGGCTAGSGADSIVFSQTAFVTDSDLALAAGDRSITTPLTIDGSLVVGTITLSTTGARAFSVMGATVSVSDIRLNGGTAMEGGLIYVNATGSLTADNLTGDNGVATGDAANMGGGAISVDGGSATISNSSFTGNSATGTSGSGGAIINKGGTLTITASTFTSNTSNRAGGAIEDANGTTSLTGVTLDQNNAGTNPGNGGGLHTGGGDVTVSGGSVTNNTAVEGGGLWSSGTLNVTDATMITGNMATGDADEAFEGGGGLFNQAGTMTVNGATIMSNSARGAGASGGGVFLNGAGTTTITNTTISQNTAIRAGGGIEVNGGTLDLREGTISGNNAGTSPGNGGGLHVTKGTVTANNGTVSGNTAIEGGGFWNNAGWTMTLNGTTFSGNMAMGPDADNGGGGVYNNGGTLIVDGATFSSNTATQGSGSGGGLLTTNGNVTITSATFDQNSSNRAGGGIEILEGTLTLTNTDFTSNMTGSSPGNGGAIHVTSSAVVTVTGGTVTGNTAAREGGGFWNQVAARMTVTGTTFDANSAAGNAADDGGGALFNNGGTMRLFSNTIVRNTATGTAGSGGGILNLGGTLRIVGGAVDSNSANRAGGGIEDSNGLVQMDSVMVRGNSIATAAPGNGGGLHSGGGTVTVTNSSFLSNTAVEGGGLWSNGVLSIVSTEDGDMFVMDNTATGNDADKGGGGIYAESAATLTMIGVMVEGNAATGTSGSGGGLFIADGVQATVAKGTISNNRANRAGGGIEIANDPMADGVASLTLDDVEVNGNTIAVAAPGNGGGIHSGGGALIVKGGSVSSNSAVEGGGIWSNGSVLIERDEDDADALISDNTASGDDATNGGGGLYAETGGDFNVQGATIEGNSATGTSGSGGGVFVADGASVVMEEVDIIDNSANRAGGGIEVADDATTGDKASLTLTRVNVGFNSIATANPGNGGGLHVGGTGEAFVSQSAFVFNEANEGGGLWISGGGDLSLRLSTVSGNSATGDGGGIYDNGDGGQIRIADATIAGNTASGNGGGLLSQSADGSTFSFTNTIVGDNSAAQGNQCSGTFAVRGANIIEETAGCTLTEAQGANTIVADPLLADLMDNGGETVTQALRANSPAVDAGTSAFNMDQRGFMRVGRADIGAFERGAASPTCSPDAPVAFGDYSAGDDQFVTITAIGTATTDLTGCTFAVYDISTETIGFSATPDGEVSTGRDFRFGEENSDDGNLPDGTLRPARGALLLFSGDVTDGDAVTDADLSRIVAAKVYDGGSVTLNISGGATPDEQQQLRAALGAIFTSVETEAGTIELALTAHPNPARQGARVGFGVESTQRVVVTVYDMLGRSVATLADRTYAPGRYTADLDAGRLAAGLYVIRIEAGDRTETTRLTVVR